MKPHCTIPCQCGSVVRCGATSTRHSCKCVYETIVQDPKLFFYAELSSGYFDRQTTIESGCVVFEHVCSVGFKFFVLSTLVHSGDTVRLHSCSSVPAVLVLSDALLGRLYTFRISRVFLVKHTTKYVTLTIHFSHFMRISCFTNVAKK